MEWFKALVAIFGMAGILIFLPLSSIAQEVKVEGDKVIVAQEQVYTKKQLEEQKKMLEAQIINAQDTLNKINELLAQMPEQPTQNKTINTTLFKVSR